jgi:hypothetical protein
MTTEVLWSSTPTPGLPDVNESQNVTLGTAVQFGVAGTALGVQFLAPQNPSGTYEGVMWEATLDDNPAETGTGTVLANKTFGAITAAVMNSVTFDTPITIDTSKTYVFGIRTSAGRYAATGGYFATAVVVGDITAVADQATTPLGTIANGRFIDGSITAYPNKTFGHNGYFAGPIFQPSGGGPEVHTTTGTAAGGMAGTATVVTLRITAGTARGGMAATAVHSGGDGGDPVDGANYDLNDIFDAIAATFDGVPTGDTIGGAPITLECHAEVAGAINPPSIVLDFDGQDWNLNMGRGADSFTIVAALMVTYNENENSQRTLRSFLSRKRSAGLFRIMAALEANQTLNGLVSYAIITSTRSVGIVTYDGVDYLGAELIIEVTS